MKYIPSKTIRIPLKVFSRISPDGMIRLPTSEEEAEALNSTFEDDVDQHQHDLDHDDNGMTNFHDDDDDIPPTVGTGQGKKVKMTENEEDFFDVSDGEDEGQEALPTQSMGLGAARRLSAGEDNATKAWRD